MSARGPLTPLLAGRIAGRAEALGRLGACQRSGVRRGDENRHDVLRLGVMSVAIAVRTGEETRQLQVVCLDELVPADDLLRRVEGLVSWHAVRESARPYYVDFGRPGVDPVVLMKLFLVAALRGIGSMRECLRVAGDSVSIRRFLGYGLTEPLPHHATLSYAQCVRFAGSPVFEQLFTQVLGACREAGLLDGERLVVDATHVEANAALRSLRAELERAAEGEATNGAEPADGPEPAPQLALAAPRRGPTPRRRASNATATSRTDPDAKLRHKPGHRPHLVHRAQVATDPKARCVVAVRAEPATGHEGDAVPELVRRARWAGHRVGELAADQGYASQATYQDLDRRGITAFIPPQPRMLGHAEGRAAHARCQSARGRAADAERQAHAEGAIAELKLRHALHRARCRGTPKLQVQLLLGGTAINLKRLISHSDAGAGAAAGGGKANPANRPSLWLYELCLN
jgi:transposase